MNKKKTHTPVSRVGRPNKSYDLPSRFCYNHTCIILFYYNRRRSGCDPRHVPRTVVGTCIIFFIGIRLFDKKKKKKFPVFQNASRFRTYEIYINITYTKPARAIWRKRHRTVIYHVFVCILKYLYAIKIPPDGV